MSNAGPLIDEDDDLEDLYTQKFRLLVREHGVFVKYERDRAALDIGLHLTTPEGRQRRVSNPRIWFQLKGKHKETLPLEEYGRSKDIPVVVKLQDLRFWFASPEPIYLVVYVESADVFLLEDVRELVDRQWGEEFLAPGTFPESQTKVTVRIRRDAILTSERLTLMRRHESMRIDGPFFRGRPLGHRLDPLRCTLNKLDPPNYVKLIRRLLELHDYRITEPLNTADLFASELPAVEHGVLTEGRLYATFEWFPQLFTEFGIGPNDDFRDEGPPQFGHGPTAIFIHGDPRTRPQAEQLHIFARRLLEKQIGQLLVFANTDDQAYFGSFFGGLRGTGVDCIPQLLGDLAYSLLTATKVYLEFRDKVSWKLLNYLWSSNEASQPTTDRARRG